MLTLYGIKNCDTVKRAREWLNANGVVFNFHDFRKDGIDARTLESWLNEVGSEKLVNRQSRTWRTLDDDTRHQVEDINPGPVLLTLPTLIRRPVLVDGDRLLVGFDEHNYSQFFKGDQET